MILYSILSSPPWSVGEMCWLDFNILSNLTDYNLLPKTFKIVVTQKKF